MGYPPPAISWTKRFDQILTETAVIEGQTLTIVKAKKKDAGTHTVLRFKCQAWALRTL